MNWQPRSQSYRSRTQGKSSRFMYSVVWATDIDHKTSLLFVYDVVLWFHTQKHTGFRTGMFRLSLSLPGLNRQAIGLLLPTGHGCKRAHIKVKRQSYEIRLGEQLTAIWVATAVHKFWPREGQWLICNSARETDEHTQVAKKFGQFIFYFVRKKEHKNGKEQYMARVFLLPWLFRLFVCYIFLCLLSSFWSFCHLFLVVRY